PHPRRVPTTTSAERIRARCRPLPARARTASAHADAASVRRGFVPRGWSGNHSLQHLEIRVPPHRRETQDVVLAPRVGGGELVHVEEEAARPRGELAPEKGHHIERLEPNVRA